MTYPLWYPKAIGKTTPNSSTRNGWAPEAIVLHVADGTLAGGDSWFASPDSGVSAHFMVGKNGEVHQYLPLDRAAWANGGIEAGYTAALITENDIANPNLWTISIEHEGMSGDGIPPAQWDASVELAAWLFENVLLVAGATGVAVDRKHVLLHRDISPLSRSRCPGWRDLDVAQYIGAVQYALAPIAAAPAKIPDVTRARTLLREAMDALDG